MACYLRRNWKICFAVCLLQIVGWGMQAGVQLLLMGTFEAAMQYDFQRFLILCGVSLAAWGTYMGICVLTDFCQAHAIRRLNNSVRYDLYASLTGKSYVNYHSKPSGEYISWLTNDVKQMEQLAWEPFFGFVGRIAQVIWSIIVLSSLHWSLMIAAIISAVIMYFLPKAFSGRIQRQGEVCTLAQATAVSQMKDLLSGLDVLRFFGQTGRFYREGREASDKMEEPACRMRYTRGAASGIAGLVSIILQLLGDLLIVVISFLGFIRPAVLAGGSNLIAGVGNGLSNAATLWLDMAGSKPYFKNITVHAGEEKAASGENLGPVEKAITLENVSFAYDPRKPVVKDQTLTFARGGKYALTGPSGCGKSTLLKLLLGWLPDYTGSIRFDGRDARSYTPDQLQQQMSYIEQNVFLFNSTIRDNITLGGTFSQEQMAKALHESALEEDLKAMPEGLDTPVGEGGSNLSGGQKQRVAIARALIHNRSILLVDEGTSALDQEKADIVEKSLLGNPDLTLILVSHHLSPERKACFTRVYELA